MGAGGVAKTILLIINVIFLLLGLCFLIIGIVLHLDDELGDKEIIAALNEVEIMGNIGLGGLLSFLAIASIALGLFIVLVSFLGILGAIKKNKCLLITYTIIVLVIFLGHLVLLILWAVQKEKVEKYLLDGLTDALRLYGGINSDNEVSIGLDYMFIAYECCGVRPVSSANDQEFNVAEWWPSRGSDKVPTSCCKGATKKNYKAMTNTACTQSLTAHQTKGCGTVFSDWLETYQTAAIVITVMFLLVELAAGIFAIVLIVATKRSNKIY